ncbi:hypothetical protein RFI_29301 [Reticulomyxa filosa]|uniref:Uncharacterized protein n=1 Tax=Reticulomyxa filosa TaxID=46433 RepID=X6M3P0_RETFI|nr:hypothetical protein RFI_29301 [Reticulomyxa filosa]|eukprot:ETO08087.1 hypothetical protein RFI_29301 [Reticulomyxa filosa]
MLELRSKTGNGSDYILSTFYIDKIKRSCGKFKYTFAVSVGNLSENVLGFFKSSSNLDNFRVFFDRKSHLNGLWWNFNNDLHGYYLYVSSFHVGWNKMENGNENVVTVRSYNPAESTQEWKHFEIVTDFDNHTIAPGWKRSEHVEVETFSNIELGSYHLVMMVSSNSVVQLLSVEDLSTV